MIAKRIAKKPEVRDDYGHLGRYVAAAREKGEKLDRFWIVNCDAGTGLADLDTALIEIEATRAMKPGINDRTYHLVVSFRPGELERLSTEDLQDIERHLADALGFGEHQRVAGTHINTDNGHLHVAYNKVHPVTHRCWTPHQDFPKMQKACRAMEAKYGLHVDRGMGDPNPISPKARDFEARTWQQSFDSHLVEHRAEILATIAGAGTWRELHAGLAEFDVELRKRGAGLAFRQIGGKGAMKASALDRSCSLKGLEERLGAFEPAPERKATDKAPPRPPKRPYQAKPLTRHPATDRLWRHYRQEKGPGFLGRNFHIRNWKSYLLADAHKDALALAIILTYKELLHMLDEATTPRRGPYRAPRSLNPALKTWFAGAPWRRPGIAGIAADQVEEMDLRTDQAGMMLVPYRDREGHIRMVRAIDPLGRTVEIGEMGHGLTHVIDPGGYLGDGAAGYAGPITVTADPLASVALYRETGAPVVVVGREAELPAAAAALRANHPVNPITVVAVSPSNAARRAAVAIDGELRLVKPDQVVTSWVADAAMVRPVAVDRTVAEAMGAFVETALTADEAGKTPATKPRYTKQERAPGKEPGIER